MLNEFPPLRVYKWLIKPQIRNYAHNMIQKRKETASLVKGGTAYRKSKCNGDLQGRWVHTDTEDAQQLPKERPLAYGCWYWVVGFWLIMLV